MAIRTTAEREEQLAGWLRYLGWLTDRRYHEPFDRLSPSAGSRSLWATLPACAAIFWKNAASPLHNHLEVFVSDNGQTLDYDKLNS